MRKSNVQLQRDVIDELRWDPDIDPGTVAVAVREGVVALFGEQATSSARLAAVRAAERVPGVRAVADNIVVQVPGSLRRTDTGIAADVTDVLSRDSDVPDSVKARVNDGWLCLEGVVEWPYQARAAEDAIRSCSRIFGLRGITNDIAIARPAGLPAIRTVHPVCLAN
jgi:osmotically-inducible protein OsmY